MTGGSPVYPAGAGDEMFLVRLHRSPAGGSGRPLRLRGERADGRRPGRARRRASLDGEAGCAAAPGRVGGANPLAPMGGVALYAVWAFAFGGNLFPLVLIFTSSVALV